MRIFPWLRSHLSSLTPAGIFLGLGCALSLFFVLVSGVVHHFAESVHLPFERRLAGVDISAERAPLTFANVVSTTWQKGVADRAVDFLAWRNWLIRVNNEILYSVFAEAGNAALYVGRGGELYENSYIKEYCSRDLADFEPKARLWAGHLREIQDFFTARGKLFLYLITPSKAAVYPEYFLGRVACAASPADRIGLLPLYARILRQAGVNYVDGATITRSNRNSYDVELFSRGGTHWTTLASALTVNAAIEEINRLALSRPLPNVRATYTLSNTAKGTDADLANLMNQVFPRRNYPVPMTTFAPVDDASAPACDPLRVGAIGGSFTLQFGEVLAETRCARIHLFYYFKLGEFVFPGKYRASKFTTPQDVATILEDDLILLEENEQTVARSAHAPALYDLVRTMRSQP